MDPGIKTNVLLFCTVLLFTLDILQIIYTRTQIRMSLLIMLIPRVGFQKYFQPLLIPVHLGFQRIEQTFVRGRRDVASTRMPAAILKLTMMKPGPTWRRFAGARPRRRLASIVHLSDTEQDTERRSRRPQHYHGPPYVS